MKEAIALFSRLYEQDVELRSEGDRLQVRAAKGWLDEATRQALSTHKAQLLSLITGVGDDIPASEGQQRLWIIDQQMHNDAYHIGLCVTLDGPLDGARLAQGVNEEIAYHPALRTRLYETDSGLCQRADAEVPQVRLENDPTAEPLSLLDALASRPFSLSEAPVRARLIAVNAQRHLLLLVIHHSAADGWSLGILLNGISRRYRGNRWSNHYRRFIGQRLALKRTMPGGRNCCKMRRSPSVFQRPTKESSRPDILRSL